MRAVDVECFAGGFSLGVKQAGFDLVGKRELPGGFGVPSVSANMPDLPIQVGQAEEWEPLDDLDLLFGNPPCSAFSGVSDKNFAGADNAINQCMWALVEYAARCNAGKGPPVVVYESVQNAYSRGLPLLRELHARLKELTGEPYVLHHVLHNAYALGGCAERRRYFWVAAKVPLGLRNTPPDRFPTLWDAIADLSGLDYKTLAPQPYKYGPTWWSEAQGLRSPEGTVDGHLSFQPQYHRQSQALLDRGYGEDGWLQGESLSSALRRFVDRYGHFPTVEDERDERFVAHYGPSGRDFNFGGAWQPERWRPERPARVVTGGSSARSIHPYEPRPLTLREMYRIQGFPDTWKLEPAVALASPNTATLWPGKGIPVQSGRWIASQVRRSLEGDAEHDRALSQLNDDEFTWDGTSDHRRKTPATSRPRRSDTIRPTTTKETKVAAAGPDLNGNDPTKVRELLERDGTATVNLAGLDDKQAKKARELLYGAAYGMNRKVKVRTDKTAMTATGVLVPVDEQAAAPPVRRSKPLVDVNEAFAKTVAASTEPPPQLQPRWKPGDRHTSADGRVWSLNLTSTEWLEVPKALLDAEAAAARVDGEVQKPLGVDPVIRCGGCQEHVAMSELQAHIDARHRCVHGRYEADGCDDCAVPEVEPPTTPTQGLLPGGGSLVFDDPEREGDGVADVPVMEPVGAPFHAPAGTVSHVSPLPVTESEDESVHDLDREPQPTDGPEYHAEHAAWEERKRTYDLQPKNSAREVKDRRFDLTQLRAGTHGYYVHRDYASHWLRWGWATRLCGPETKLLEVGCGQDLPLTRVFIYHNGVPKEMVSVDLNRIKEHVQPKWFTLYDETNFLEAQGAIVAKHGLFDVATCFEVIEHMPREDGQDLLVALRDSITPDGLVLLSTPCFNGKAAANHIHEYTVPELEEAVKQAGLRVERRHGTFASYYDVKRGLTAYYGDRADLANEAIKLYEELRGWFADDVLACLYAPLLPDHSRNNAWVLKRA